MFRNADEFLITEYGRVQTGMTLRPNVFSNYHTISTLHPRKSQGCSCSMFMPSLSLDLAVWGKMDLLF